MLDALRGINCVTVLGWDTNKSVLQYAPWSNTVEYWVFPLASSVCVACGLVVTGFCLVNLVPNIFLKLVSVFE